MAYNLDKELNDVVAQMMSQPGMNGIETNTPTTPVVPAPVEPVVAPVNTNPNAEPVPQAAPTTHPVQVPIDVNAVVEDWDITAQAPAEPVAPVSTTPSNTPTVDFSEIAKVLNLGEIKGKEDFVKAAQELKQKADTLGSLPVDLAKAIEIARSGGNYLEYLNIGTVDWAQEDPVVLYENYIIDRFTNKEGMVDSDKVDKILDKMDDDEKELRGRELQSQYVMLQGQRKNALEQEARQRQMQFENELKSAVNAVEAISGFKLSAQNKAELYSDIMSGADLKYNDLKSRVETAALRKYWNKMDEYRKTQIKNATMRQTLEDATFPNIKPTSTPAAPENPNNKYSLKDYIQELEQRSFRR